MAPHLRKHGYILTIFDANPVCCFTIYFSLQSNPPPPCNGSRFDVFEYSFFIFFSRSFCLCLFVDCAPNPSSFLFLALPSQASGKEALEAGARSASSPAEVAAESDIVITMLPTSAVVREVCI